MPPTEMIERLNGEIEAALADPKVRSKLAELGAVPMPMTPDGFGKLIADETEKWGKVIRTLKLRALAVTGATRSQALPNIPTVGEFVPGYEATSTAFPWNNSYHAAVSIL